ncbi:MAG: cyclase family protein [Kiritimatiellaeota bacterium]|nr:cyclase family protein [Kiritimatiellota bacterium]
MLLVDLTLPLPEQTARLTEVPIRSSGAAYTGMTYRLSINSMHGTYIDFPGHIKETDDGAHASNYPVEKLFRVDAVVVRLDRASGSGAVTAEELAAAFPKTTPPDGPPGALIVNALGNRRFDEIAPRSVYFAHDAIRWIIERNVHLLISDIYESRAIHGVFTELFRSRIAAVCSAVNLACLTAPVVKVSVFHLPIPGVTQLPCRVIAELTPREIQ